VSIDVDGDRDPGVPDDLGGGLGAAVLGWPLEPAAFAPGLGHVRLVRSFDATGRPEDGGLAGAALAAGSAPAVCSSLWTFSPGMVMVLLSFAGEPAGEITVPAGGRATVAPQAGR
jgi:hypothetical protein